jgi:hypothetical protein
MVVAVYWWRVHPGKEEQFRRAWRRGTDLIRERCGSYGSRLHRDADRRFVGYAECVLRRRLTNNGSPTILIPGAILQATVWLGGG